MTTPSPVVPAFYDFGSPSDISPIDLAAVAALLDNPAPWSFADQPAFPQGLPLTQ